MIDCLRPIAETFHINSGLIARHALETYSMGTLYSHATLAKFEGFIFCVQQTHLVQNT